MVVDHECASPDRINVVAHFSDVILSRRRQKGGAVQTEVEARYIARLGYMPKRRLLSAQGEFRLVS